MLNKWLDGFVGNMTSSKWAKMCNDSQDTASREIKSLVKAGILVQLGVGRPTHYEIASDSLLVNGVGDRVICK